MTIKSYTKETKLLVKDSYKYPSEFDPFQKNAMPKAFKIGQTVPYIKGTRKRK